MIAQIIAHMHMHAYILMELKHACRHAVVAMPTDMICWSRTYVSSVTVTMTMDSQFHLFCIIF